MKIDVLLGKKGRDVVTVKPTATMATVVQRLRLERIGCVVVSEDGRHVDGILAVRDIAYAIAENEAELRHRPGADILSTPIAKLMTSTVHTCSPDDTLKNVMQEMVRCHILHVPVVDKGVLCGIVSIDDVVRFAVDEMSLESNVLHDMVTRLQTTRDI